MPTMTERPRFTFDAPETTRRAIAMYAAQFGMTLGEALEHLVNEHLAEYVRLAEQGMAAGATPPKPRRGRKPKPRD